MATVTVNDSNLYDIADSIRAKLGVQTTYKPSQMAGAIDSISGGGITPTGEIEITENGTYDVTQYASAEVDVPTGSTPVINSLSVTENGTYTAPTGVDGYSPITVNVSSGGGYTAADFADASKPTGVFVFDNVTFPSDSVWFAKRTGITKLFGTNYNETGNRTGTFRGMTGLQYAIFPKLTRAYNNFLYECSNLEAVDWYGGGTGGTMIFASCPKLKTMVIRKSDGICALTSNNAFQATPFASNGSGGTLYVPSALISEYQAATNWSTILGYANNQILAIEGSIYKTQYVDGTPIPTT